MFYPQMLNSPVFAIHIQAHHIYKMFHELHSDLTHFVKILYLSQPYQIFSK